MKIAIFAILIISMGIIISASPESHAIDPGFSHVIGDIEGQLNDCAINSTIHDNSTSLGKIMNSPINFTSMPLDIDNSLFDTYLT